MSSPGACKKRARDDIISSDDDDHDETTTIIRQREAHYSPLAFGTFGGTTIYQNCLHAGETFAKGHVSIHNLVLEDCSCALITTFALDPIADQLWLESIFSPFTQVTFVAHKAQGPIVGHATLQPLYTPTTNPNWRLLECQPHTGGCLHAKLLLFRNPHGLRVVVSGNNFFQGQWQVDRDVLWVQDFSTTTTTSSSSSNAGCYGGEFQATLVSLVQDLVKCENPQDQRVVNVQMEALLQGIDFVPAQGRLVTSFPTSVAGKERGGYRQLALAVTSFQNELDSHGSDESDNDDCNHEHENQNYANNNDVIPEGSIVYATSGSMGDLRPDFMLQMYQAFACGQEVHASSSTPWHVLYDKIKCLWPSRETALTMNAMAFVCHARSMSRLHWNDYIPEMAKRRVFFDARPNPTTKGELPYFPFAHCKTMYIATPNMSLVYVGSHNFSKSAWGLRGEMPRNVELGVVLATKSPIVRKEWKSRLPCLLPNASETSSPSYIPASAHSGIRQAMQQGNVKEAMEMTREWLTRKEERQHGNEKAKNDSGNETNDKDSHIIKADVVDLCHDSD